MASRTCDAISHPASPSRSVRRSSGSPCSYPHVPRPSRHTLPPSPKNHAFPLSLPARLVCATLNGPPVFLASSPFLLFSSLLPLSLFLFPPSTILCLFLPFRRPVHPRLLFLLLFLGYLSSFPTVPSRFLFHQAVLYPSSSSPALCSLLHAISPSVDRPSPSSRPFPSAVFPSQLSTSDSHRDQSPLIALPLPKFSGFLRGFGFSFFLFFFYIRHNARCVPSFYPFPGSRLPCSLEYTASSQRHYPTRSLPLWAHEEETLATRRQI